MKKALPFLLILVLALAFIPTSALAAGRTVYADTAFELEDAIASNTRIVLSAKTYYLDYGLWIDGIEGLEIVGTAGTRIVSAFGYDDVFTIWASKNIQIYNVAFGYNISVIDYCESGALYIAYSEDIVIDGCELSGYGAYGFVVDDCYNLKFNKCAIKDCFDQIGRIYDCEVEFSGCTFKNNGYSSHQSEEFEAALDLIYYYALPLATFNNCVFENNKSANFKFEASTELSYDYGVYKTAYNEGYTRVNGCTFTNNAWQSGPKPAPSETAPDDWAKAELRQATNMGLVPYSISDPGWRVPTTRLAAAEAMVSVIEHTTGKTAMQIAAENGWNLAENTFADTGSLAVTFLKYAGIVTGIGGNKYDPESTYTRAQAVTMIGRAAEAFFGEAAKGANPFRDVPSWAAPYVGYAADRGITNGIGGGLFNSNGVLTNQETAVFCFRAYLAWAG